MPYKDPIKAKEYQRNYAANNKDRVKSGQPNGMQRIKTGCEKERARRIVKSAEVKPIGAGQLTIK